MSDILLRLRLEKRYTMAPGLMEEAADEIERLRAALKRLVHDKGFGFIAAGDGSEYFFHQSACQTPFDDLREGQAVSFEKGQGPKGPRAENVKLA